MWRHVLLLAWALVQCCASTAVNITRDTQGGGAYQFMVPELPYRERGLAHRGSLARLRIAMHRLLFLKQNITVAFIGGSITAGHTGKKKFGWPYYIEAPLAAAFGAEAAARMRLVNGAIPATGSAWFAACHKLRVPPDADVVFLEFGVNDGSHGCALDGGGRKVYEQLVRKLLKYRNRPALVTYNHYEAFLPQNVTLSYWQRAWQTESQLHEIGR